MRVFIDLAGVPDDDVLKFVGDVIDYRNGIVALTGAPVGMLTGRIAGVGEIVSCGNPRRRPMLVTHAVTPAAEVRPGMGVVETRKVLADISDTSLMECLEAGEPGHDEEPGRSEPICGPEPPGHVITRAFPGSPASRNLAKRGMESGP